MRNLQNWPLPCSKFLHSNFELEVIEWNAGMIRRTAVRETGVSRHQSCPIKGLLKLLEHDGSRVSRGLRDTPQSGHYYTESS